MLSAEQIESLKTYAEDVTNPDRLIKFLTGKSLLELQVEQARRVWDGEYEDTHKLDIKKLVSASEDAPITYSFDSLFNFLDEWDKNGIDRVLRNEINEILVSKYGVEFAVLWNILPSQKHYDKIGSSMMQKKFPGIKASVTVEALRKIMIEFRDEQKIELYEYIKTKIRDGVLKELIGEDQGAKRVKLDCE